MKRHFANLVLLFMMGAWALPAFSQTVLPYEDVDDLRYQFIAHNFSVDGVEHEIYIKLDCYTGKTWRFSADSPKWAAIAEPSNGRPRGASNMNRYELLPHNYIDTSGDPQEIMLRADSMTGYTWAYRGANGTWQDIPQE